MSKILDFTHDPHLRAFNTFVQRVNAMVAREYGRGLDLSRDIGKTFTTELTDYRGNSSKVEIRLNDTVPNAELFSLAMELVRPADEPFSARSIFEADGSFHEGSQTVGYDLVNEHGEAKLVATGRTASAIPRASTSIDRVVQAVVKIMAELEVTRDDIQQLNLRNDRGLAPLVDLLQEVIQGARKNIARQEDYILWTGGNIEGIAAGRLNGLMDFFSSVSGDYSGSAPTKGQKAAVVAGVGGTTWALKTSEEIIRDISTAAAYVVRNGTYIPNTLILPYQVLTSSLALRKTSEVDSTPLITWIKRTFADAFGVDLKVVATNALVGGTVSGTTRGNTKITASENAFILLDNRRENMVIADVESTILLPSVEDTQGTLRQVAQLKTGGMMVKHPSSMYMGTGI